MKNLIKNIYDKLLKVQANIVINILRIVLNYRLIGLTSLIFIAICSLFKWRNADLSNNVLILCGIIFISSIYDELQKWNLWGFKGEKRDLTQVPQGESISNDAERPSQDDIEEAENKQIQLMPTGKGNFLELAFEIERLLRVIATLKIGESITPSTNIKYIVEKLHNLGIVTDQGKAQVEAVVWLRNKFVHGRANEVNDQTLITGIEIAYKFYKELHEWLNPPQNNNTN